MSNTGDGATLYDTTRKPNVADPLLSAYIDPSLQFYIVFDGPPGPESGRFVEAETDTGRSVAVGEWRQRGEYWLLGPFTEPDASQALIDHLDDRNSALVTALQEINSVLPGDSRTDIASAALAADRRAIRERKS